MARIHQLPPNVITKIAAGEVIERPASVVKEMLENSIDAGATRIDVEIENGGMDRIVIVDNGCGIDADDLPLVFASHATSKLNDADDLFRVATLGFRGEAMASIGGVAQVTLQSRPVSSESGNQIHCRGGELSPVKPWNGAPGTRIEVRHLFYNTPVRRKFMRTTATEAGHISEAITRLALAYPTLQITLTHNGKKVHEVPASATLPERIGIFFGDEIKERLFPIEAARGPAKLMGFVADPAIERGNNRLQYLFLNGRHIRDRSLGHAIQEAYRGLLMTGRYAVAFLFLELPPDHVDVNVHPTKAEVRFRDAQAIFHLVLSTIRNRLNAESLVPKLQAPVVAAPVAPMARPDPPAELFARPPEMPLDHDEAENGESPQYYNLSAINGRTVAVPAPHPPVNRSLRALQLHDSYIVLETPEGMLVIDQHALHERILFEQLKKRWREGSIEKQPLLTPEPVELSAEQAARVVEAKSELAELGLDVDGFGGTTVLLSSCPAVLHKLAPHQILKDVVDFLSSQDRAPSREQMLNDLLSMMACKAAVKAGDRLSPEQMTALLEQRHLVQDSHHCPHGRPTSLLFSRKDLDKQFGRI